MKKILILVAVLAAALSAIGAVGLAYAKTASLSVNAAGINAAATPVPGMAPIPATAPK